jgi:hypothetical protein
MQQLTLDGKNGGFMRMIFSILGVVLAVTMFGNTMTFFDTLAAVPNASAYIAYSIGIEISPSIILLGIMGVAQWQYRKGYSQATDSGVNGLLMVVFGFLEIILFLALFPTIMAALETVRTLGTIDNYIALKVVVEIMPIVLYLGGLFAGGATTIGGLRQNKKQKAGTQAQT